LQLAELALHVDEVRELFDDLVEVTCEGLKGVHMFHELVEVLLLEPLLLDMFGLLCGLSHDHVGLVEGGLGLLD
jgi:hypothetical protein